MKLLDSQQMTKEEVVNYMSDEEFPSDIEYVIGEYAGEQN